MEGSGPPRTRHIDVSTVVALQIASSTRPKRVTVAVGGFTAAGGTEDANITSLADAFTVDISMTESPAALGV